MAFGLNTEEQWEDYQKYINEFNLNDEDSSYFDQEREKGIRKDIKQTFLTSVPIQYPFGQINLPLPRFFLVQDKYYLPFIEFYKYVKNSNEYNIKMLLNDVEDEDLKFKISSKPFFNKNILLELDRETKQNIYFRAQRNTYDIKNVDIVFTEVFENFYTNDQDNEESLDIFRDLHKDIKNLKFSDLEVIQDNKQKKIMIDRIFNEYYNNDNSIMIFFIKKFFEITGFSYIDETIEFYLPILWRIYIISRYQKNMENEEIQEIINSYFEQILLSELNLTFQDITNKEKQFNIERFMILRKDKLDSFEKQFDPFFFKIKFLTSEYNYTQYLNYFEHRDNYVKWNKFFLQDLFLRGKISLDDLQNYIEGVQQQLKEDFQDIEFFTETENNTKNYKLLLQTLYEDKIPVLEYLIQSENKKTNYPICMNETDIDYYEVYDQDWFIEEFEKDLLGEQEEYRIIYGDIGKLSREIEQTFLLQIPIMKQYEGKVVIPLRVPSQIQFESPFRIKRSKYIEVVTQTETTFIELMANNKVRDINNKKIIGEFNEQLNLLVININDSTFEFRNLQKIFFDIEFDITIEYTDDEIRTNYSDYLSEDNEFIYFELPLNKQFRLKRKMPGLDIESDQGIPQQTVFLQEQGQSGSEQYMFSADFLQTTIKQTSINIKIDGQTVQTDDGLGNIIGEYNEEPVSGEVDYQDGTILITTTQAVLSTSNVTLDYEIQWESTNYFNIERDDKITLSLGTYDDIYLDQTNNLFYDKTEYSEELEENIKRPVNIGRYLEKERTIIIKKYFDTQVKRDYTDTTLTPDVLIDDELNITLDVMYVKDYIYYLFSTLFQEYNYWYTTHNYRDKTSQFIYNKYKVSKLREMDYFQLQHIHKEILYRTLFDVYFVNENHYNKQGCVYNQIYPSTLNKLNEHLFEMNNYVDIIPTFDMFYFDFKKLFKNLKINTPDTSIKYNTTTNENEKISTEEKRRLLISLSKNNLLLKLNDSINTDNSLNPFFDQNRYILSSQNKFNSNKLNNFILYNYQENTIEEIEKNSNFLSYFPQFQLDFKYEYQFQDLREMNVSVENLQMEVLDTIKLIKLGSLEGLIKQGTSYFNFKW